MKATLTLALSLGLTGIASAQFEAAHQPQKFPAKVDNGGINQTNGGGVLLASDDCSTPNPIAGQGVFNYDTTGATTGTQGQAECSGTINNDVWFIWTADATGNALVTTCGTGTYDTELAAYPGAPSCPIDGTSLDCNDDFCGLQSGLTFPVTNGTSYIIQAGAFSTTGFGVSALNITISAPAGNDDCSNPDIIAGQGTFGFDSSGASTGAEGQNETNCYAFATTGIDNDVWFEWTADDDGIATVQTCGLASHDTKIAAYPGSGCPLDGTSITCNDDSCGLQSAISFPVTNGSTYTLQIGSFPGASGGIGSIGIAIAPPPPPCTYTLDDGTTENSIGLTAGGGMVWMHGFNASGPGNSDQIDQISSAYGTPLFPGLPPGQAITVCVWDDPTNDFDPSDCVLLYSQTGNAANEDTDILNDYVIPSVAVSGVFFVGVAYDNPAGTFPGPLDQSSGAGGGQVWVFGNTTTSGGYATLNLNNPAANDVPPLDVDLIGFPGRWLLRATGKGCNGLGTKYCSANPNSTGSPADIAASGSASVGAGDLTLTAAPVPNQNGIFFHGAAQQQIAFGNGFLCVRQGIRRGSVVGASANSASYTYDNSNVAHSLSGFENTNRNFQYWHRDPMGGGALFNTSNAIEIPILP